MYERSDVPQLVFESFVLSKELCQFSGCEINVSSSNEYDNAVMMQMQFNPVAVQAFKVNAIVSDQYAFEDDGMLELGFVALPKHPFVARRCGCDVASLEERGDENGHVFVKVNACHSNLPECGWLR